MTLVLRVYKYEARPPQDRLTTWTSLTVELVWHRRYTPWLERSCLIVTTPEFLSKTSFHPLGGPSISRSDLLGPFRGAKKCAAVVREFRVCETAASALRKNEGVVELLATKRMPCAQTSRPFSDLKLHPKRFFFFYHGHLN